MSCVDIAPVTVLSVKSSNKQTVLPWSRVGFLEIPGPPFPLRHLHWDPNLVCGGGGGGEVWKEAAGRCARGTHGGTPASLPHSGLSPPKEIGGRRGMRRFPSSTGACKVRSPSPSLCFWTRLNTRRGVGAFSTTRQNGGLKTWKSGPSSLTCWAGRPARRSSGPLTVCASISAPLPGPPPLLLRFEKPAARLSRRGHQPPARPYQVRPQEEGRRRPPA